MHGSFPSLVAKCKVLDPSRCHLASFTLNLPRSLVSLSCHPPKRSGLPRTSRYPNLTSMGAAMSWFASLPDWSGLYVSLATDTMSFGELMSPSLQVEVLDSRPPNALSDVVGISSSQLGRPEYAPSVTDPPRLVTYLPGQLASAAIPSSLSINSLHQLNAANTFVRYGLLGSPRGRNTRRRPSKCSCVRLDLASSVEP